MPNKSDGPDFARVIVGDEMKTLELPESSIVKGTNGANRVWFPNDRRLRSRKATDAAVRIAELLAANKESEMAEFDEQTVFIALHVCSYRAQLAERQQDPEAHSDASTWWKRRSLIRTWLVTQNLGLIYHGIGRFRGVRMDRDDMSSEGMLALLRSVDRFDPWRGVRFSTYAYNSIIRALARVARRSDQYRRAFPATYESGAEEPEAEDTWTELYVDRLRQALQNNLGDLTEREAEILIHRFPKENERRQTLEQIGAECGLSKERIRQIQNRALKKLRNVLEMDPLLQ